jgi:nitroimidazol reductase NimA-like FMN-containing flavoprotein (pyridoxamine 5'-phosphate oxidase superfamily)
MDAGRYLQPLDRQQALDLLGGTTVGRIAFALDEVPVIRPVNHALVDGDLVVRSHVGTALVAALRAGRVPVAYEADALEPAERTGWSVVVRGLAGLVTDEADLDRYERLVVPWIDQPKNQVVRVEIQAVSGYALVP